MKIDWKKIFIAIMDHEPTGNEILVNGELFYFQPVIVLKENRLGYMVIWHESTKTATQLSRFKVPIYMESISSEDEVSEYIPSDLTYEPLTK